MHTPSSPAASPPAAKRPPASHPRFKPVKHSIWDVPANRDLALIGLVVLLIVVGAVNEVRGELAKDDALNAAIQACKAGGGEPIHQRPWWYCVDKAALGVPIGKSPRGPQ